MKALTKKALTKKLNTALKVKHSGQSDLIASLFVILAMTIFVLFFILAIKDVDTKIQMDQIARKYILRMESSGKLTSEEIKELKKELSNINSVAEAIEAGYEIKVTWNNNQGAKGYGSTVTLKIECPAVTTSYDAKSGIMGSVSGSNIQVFIIEKQSTAKY